MHHTLHPLFIVLLFALSSCAIQVDLPEQFLVTSASPHELKGTTADNAIFWVQKYGLPKRGSNLNFWVTALKTDFVDNRGYTLLEEEPIETHAGVKGTQMLYEATTQGRTYGYLVAVFVHPGPVACVARFTAEKAEFDEYVDAVKQAILTTRG